MAIKRFKCEVTRVDEYIIEFDTEKYTEKEMEEFRESFYQFHELRDHAEHLAQFQSRFGHAFIEGYGYVNRNGERTYIPEFGKENPCICEGINIQIISEDDECEVDIIELKEDEGN